MPGTPPPPLAPLVANLLDNLQKLRQHAPHLELKALAGTLDPLLVFADKRKLLSSSPPKLTKAITTAATKKLERAINDALDAATAAAAAPAPEPKATPGYDRVPGWLRYHRAVIHVDPHRAFYSWAAPYKRVRKGRTTTGTGLTTLDSSGKVYPTLRHDPHLPHRVVDVERAAAACAPQLLTDPPEALLSPQALKASLERLRTEFPDDLPFRSPLHERRLRVWCLMTYLHPLVESTPFLRVRVPDLRSARNVQHLLEACCWSALGVSRSGKKATIRRHRAALAATTIFSPELRTGRLPASALDLLGELPRTERLEPPVAYVELWDDTRPPRVPQEWIVDVELGGQVGPQPLPADHRHLGCAVALIDNAALLSKVPLEEGTAGLARWLQELIYGDVLTDKQLASAAAAAEAKEASGFVIQKSELAGFAEQVWATCLQEASDDDAASGLQQRRCNPACLRQRMLKQIPRARKLLDAAGSAYFAQMLLEHDVVTYTLKNVRGCLSSSKSAEWRTLHARGVEVPRHRLPAGQELG
jgi:hypothetical protein